MVQVEKEGNEEFSFGIIWHEFSDSVKSFEINFVNQSITLYEFSESVDHLTSI